MESNVGQVRTFQELKYSKDYVIFRICYYISEIGDLFPLSKQEDATTQPTNIQHVSRFFHVPVQQCASIRPSTLFDAHRHER